MRVETQGKLVLGFESDDEYLNNKQIKALKELENIGVEVILDRPSGQYFKSVDAYVAHINKTGRIKAQRELEETKQKLEEALADSDMLARAILDSVTREDTSLVGVARKTKKGFYEWRSRRLRNAELEEPYIYGQGVSTQLRQAWLDTYGDKS